MFASNDHPNAPLTPRRRTPCKALVVPERSVVPVPRPQSSLVSKVAGALSSIQLQRTKALHNTTRAHLDQSAEQLRRLFAFVLLALVLLVALSVYKSRSQCCTDEDLGDLYLN